MEGTANAIFFNHGQCCCAGSRLFVQDSIFDKLVGASLTRPRRSRSVRGSIPKRRWARWSLKASSTASAVIWNLALQKERRRSRVVEARGQRVFC